MTVTSAKANTTHKDAVLKDNASIANKSFSHVNDNKNPAKQHVNTIPLYLLGYISKMVNSRNRINEKIIFLHVNNTEEVCNLMHSFLD